MTLGTIALDIGVQYISIKTEMKMGMSTIEYRCNVCVNAGIFMICHSKGVSREYWCVICPVSVAGVCERAGRRDSAAESPQRLPQHEVCRQGSHTGHAQVQLF